MTTSSRSHLEQRISALDQLQREIAGDAQALARAVSAQHVARPAPAVMSVSDAARDIWVSVSMLHKLLKDRRIGHLKVGTRTLLTPQHLAGFQRAFEVEPTPTRSEPAALHRGSRRLVARAS